MSVRTAQFIDQAADSYKRVLSRLLTESSADRQPETIGCGAALSSVAGDVGNEAAGPFTDIAGVGGARQRIEAGGVSAGGGKLGTSLGRGDSRKLVYPTAQFASAAPHSFGGSLRRRL